MEEMYWIDDPVWPSNFIVRIFCDIAFAAFVLAHTLPKQQILDLQFSLIFYTMRYIGVYLTLVLHLFVVFIRCFSRFRLFWLSDIFLRPPLSQKKWKTKREIKKMISNWKDTMNNFERCYGHFRFSVVRGMAQNEWVRNSYWWFALNQTFRVQVASQQVLVFSTIVTM